MPIAYTSDGWYVCRVDTGIGEQYNAIQVTKPALALGNWNPLDGLSSHYKFLVSGPHLTAEAAMGQLAVMKASPV